MEEVNYGFMKPEYLKRGSELQASIDMSRFAANAAMDNAKNAKNNDRRSEFLNSAKMHLQNAISSAKESKSRPVKSKGSFTAKVKNRKPEAN